MVVNSSLTVFHKEFDKINRVEIWIRSNYGSKDNPKVWLNGGKGSFINKGYENANDIQIRIPYDINPKLDIDNFKLGDIIIQGKLDFDIKSPKDLSDYETYSITSVSNNTFGNNKHIHIGGK